MNKELEHILFVSDFRSVLRELKENKHHGNKNSFLAIQHKLDSIPNSILKEIIPLKEERASERKWIELQLNKIIESFTQFEDSSSSSSLSEHLAQSGIIETLSQNIISNGRFLPSSFSPNIKLKRLSSQSTDEQSSQSKKKQKLSQFQEVDVAEEIEEDKEEAQHHLDAIMSQAVEDNDQNAPTLSEEFIVECSLLKEKLFQLPPQSKELPPEIKLFHETPHLDEMCRLLELDKLEDDIIFQLFNSIITDEMSFHGCMSLFSQCLLEKVKRLTHPASRVLFTTIVNCAKKHPKPILYGLLLPLSLDINTGSAQCEVINRVVKESLPTEVVVLFLNSILESKQTSMQQQQQQQFRWTEFTVSILQNMLNLKLVLSSETVSMLVAHFEDYSEHFSKSLKFLNLIYTLICKYTSLIVPHIDILKNSVQKSDTYLKATALTKLSKIEEESK